MPVFTTACPRNCYSTCSMKVHVEKGRIVRIDPDSSNLATSEGPCLKGLSYIERAHSADRIIFPQKKNPNGGFDRISWDEAFDLITSKLVFLRDSYGPQSLLYYCGSGTKGLLNGVGSSFWKSFGGCTTTYGDLCWPAGLEATRLTLGENSHNSPWDIAKAKLIILWGKNSAETNIHQMVFINQALENGARLVVIDPRRTQTSESADLLIQPRPGTDGALALSVAHLLVKKKQIDHRFIDRNVLGFDKFAASIEDYTPDRAASIAEIPKAQVHELAELIGSIGPVSINAGFGMQRFSNSGQTIRSIIALLAITGNIGKVGAGWIFANLQGDVFSNVKDPIAFYPKTHSSEGIRNSISTARLGRDILGCSDPAIKAIWVERGNPVTQNPDTNTVLRAFRSVEFCVVVDQFLTDTTREADIILPAKNMFEQTDVIWAYWHPYIQLKPKILEPPGEVKPESEIYWHLASKLGLEHSQIEDALPKPGESHIIRFLERQLESIPGLSFERLREGPVLAPGIRETTFSDFEFPTPSGKIELYSQEAVDRWGSDPLPSFHETIESSRKESGKSKKYPLYFLTPNSKNQIHSQFINLKMIQHLSPEPILSIHPEDASKRGISQGVKVRVFNDRGYLAMTANLDFGIKPGCVSVNNGWWISNGGTVNFCSKGRETDMGHGAAFHENLVEVELIV